MTVDEQTAGFRARQLILEVKPKAIPVSLDGYASHVGAILKAQTDLEENESGWSFKNGGKHYICVNAHDLPERQRFTVCHELGHIVLNLPSDHQEVPSWSSVKRSPNEMYCDMFAAELLLPALLFQPLVAQVPISLASVDDLARKAEVSFSATGSRFAAVSRAPCAFVFAADGIIRFASRSTSLRETKGWIPPRTPLPPGSISERVRRGEPGDGPEEVDADVWFSDWQRGGVLLEETRHLKNWDQTLTLLWFEDEDIPPAKASSREQEEELGLAELDGVLPWPGRRRRK